VKTREEIEAMGRPVPEKPVPEGYPRNDDEQAFWDRVCVAIAAADGVDNCAVAFTWADALTAARRERVQSRRR
jgi:hypothetical protein